MVITTEIVVGHNSRMTVAGGGCGAGRDTAGRAVAGLVADVLGAGDASLSPSQHRPLLERQLGELEKIVADRIDLVLGQHP